MSADNTLRTSLAEAQERHAQALSVVYRLYTEDKANLGLLASERFTGFTLIRGSGYWQGLAESSAIIEIVGTPADKLAVLALRDDILFWNNQQSVLVTQQTVTTL